MTSRACTQPLGPLPWNALPGLLLFLRFVLCVSLGLRLCLVTWEEDLCVNSHVIWRATRGPRSPDWKYVYSVRLGTQSSLPSATGIL